MADIRYNLKEDVSSLFYVEYNNKIERSVLEPWRGGVFYGRDVLVVTEVIY